jgi:hypothetical protein
MLGKLAALRRATGATFDPSHQTRPRHLTWTTPADEQRFDHFRR